MVTFSTSNAPLILASGGERDTHGSGGGSLRGPHLCHRHATQEARQPGERANERRKGLFHASGSTTLDGNIRVVGVLISTPNVPYIHVQSGRLCTAVVPQPAAVKGWAGSTYRVRVFFQPRKHVLLLAVARLCRL